MNVTALSFTIRDEAFLCLYTAGCRGMKTLSFAISKEEINGQILEYEDSHTLGYRGPIEEDDAKELFRLTKTLFDEAGIKFSLIYGSLLGAVRDGGHVAKGDADIDLCVWDEEKLRENLIPLYKKGLKLCQSIPGVKYAFWIDPKKCSIDTYILRELTGWRYLVFGWGYLNLCWWETPRKFFSGWSEIEFLGEKCTCPERPERFLEWCYGSNWRIPQNKKGTYRAALPRIVCLILTVPSKILRLIFSSKYRRNLVERKKRTGSWFYK